MRFTKNKRNTRKNGRKYYVSVFKEGSIKACGFVEGVSIKSCMDYLDGCSFDYWSESNPVTILL